MEVRNSLYSSPHNLRLLVKVILKDTIKKSGIGPVPKSEEDLKIKRGIK